MLGNGISGQYLPANIKSHSNRETKSSRESLSTEKHNSGHLSVENTSAATVLDPALIAGPIFLLAMTGVVVFHKFMLYNQAKKTKIIDEYPCESCHFFSKNKHLKCAVNPSTAFTKVAINCRDYQPLKNKTKVSFLGFQSRSKIN